MVLIGYSCKVVVSLIRDHHNSKEKEKEEKGKETETLSGIFAQIVCAHWTDAQTFDGVGRARLWPIQHVAFATEPLAAVSSHRCQFCDINPVSTHYYTFPSVP